MPKYTEQYDVVLPFLESKCEEFRHYDYDTSTPENIWQFLIKKKWRKREIGDMPLHEMVNEIMEMRASEFVAYHQIEGFKGDNWFSAGNSDDLEQLLRPNPKKTK
ncbi:post-transcriptional regulator [Planococcus sp. X10-3]|uniref:post-transcriptional regulator n=1 Tax=Planococcus sp. X10-3 TaxID=3061240 RepID=UPI003BB196F8